MFARGEGELREEGEHRHCQTGDTWKPRARNYCSLLHGEGDDQRRRQREGGRSDSVTKRRQEVTVQLLECVISV